MIWDVAVVGAGPAGLSTAIAAAGQGLSVVVLERAALPHDKPCGEGLMPGGLAVLERLGVAVSGAAIEGIRYVQEDASFVEGRLARPGLGVRREVLSRALQGKARALGVEVRAGTPLRSHQREANEVRLDLEHETLRARFLVGADGLHSPVRKREGLDVPVRGTRFGFRQHFHTPPWSRVVEVHLSPGAEAYVTPVSETEVGVAVLFTKESPTLRRDWRQRFPELDRRLGTADQTTPTRGAGPFLCSARSVVQRRLALVGDAAGYVDAITGEGVSLSLELGEVLGRLLAPAVRDGASLDAYVHHWRRAFRRYAFFTHALLALARRPRVRRQVVNLLRRSPASFEWVLSQVIPIQGTSSAEIGPRPSEVPP